MLPRLPTSVAVDAVELRFPGVEGQLASAVSVSDEREALGGSCWLCEGPPPLAPVELLRRKRGASQSPSLAGCANWLAQLALELAVLSDSSAGVSNHIAQWPSLMT